MKFGDFPLVLTAKRDVTRLTEQSQLVDKDARIISVVAHRRHSGDVGHERNGGESGAFFNDRMRELDREMERVAEAAAISHGEKLLTLRKAFGHFSAQRLDLSGVFREEFLLHLDALAAFAENLVAKRLD